MSEYDESSKAATDSKSPEEPDLVGVFSIGHIEATRNYYRLILALAGLLSLICVVGGLIAAFFLNPKNLTSLDVFGAKVTTHDVGIAFTSVGMAGFGMTVFLLLRSIKNLAALPPDESRRK